MIREENVDLAVIGAGAAGLSAAVAAAEAGVGNVVVIDREHSPGGILKQCIHAGFGLYRYEEELTGPEYFQRHAMDIIRHGVKVMSDTMVLDMTPERELLLSNTDGIGVVKAGAIVLAMGCRERTRDNLLIPGTRPAGIFTAGTAQQMMNVRNLMVGRKVVVLGSGDIGMIMARRLVLEGAEVPAVLEIMPFPGGLQRNITQCLDDFGIPLHLNTTVIEIKGKGRISSVIVATVGKDGLPMERTEREIECDTLLLSVGLIPENELSRSAGVEIDGATGGPVVDANFMTSLPGVFCCGNALHVHDVVDFVSDEAEEAGYAAARWLRKDVEEFNVSVAAGDGIRYALPHRIGRSSSTLKMRVEEPGRNVVIVGKTPGNEVFRKELPRVAPSEMIIIEVGRVEGDEIVVEVVK